MASAYIGRGALRRRIVLAEEPGTIVYSELASAPSSHGATTATGTSGVTVGRIAKSAARCNSPTMFGVKAVGHHEPRQARVVGCVAFGAGVGMDRVTGIGPHPAPPLDRIVNSVHGFPVCGTVRVDIRFSVTLDTETGKVGVGNRLERIPVGESPVGAAGLERILINAVLRSATDRMGSRPPTAGAAPILGLARRCHILFIGRGDPGTFKKRHHVGLISRSHGAHPVRIMAGRAEPHDLLGRGCVHCGRLSEVPAHIRTVKRFVGIARFWTKQPVAEIGRIPVAIDRLAGGAAEFTVIAPRYAGALCLGVMAIKAKVSSRIVGVKAGRCRAAPGSRRVGGGIAPLAVGGGLEEAALVAAGSTGVTAHDAGGCAAVRVMAIKTEDINRTACVGNSSVNTVGGIPAAGIGSGIAMG